MLKDVLNGYASVVAAEREYGVVIQCSRRPGEWLSMPEHYRIDQEATAQWRNSAAAGLDSKLKLQVR